MRAPVASFAFTLSSLTAVAVHAATPAANPTAAPTACVDAPGAAPRVASATTTGDPKARDAAQRGLDFLAREAQRWQGEHQCFGCHVQGVTLEAMTVGRAHQYKVKDGDMDAIVKGMLDLPGGVHGADGFVYTGGQLSQPAKGFGGTAFAHYDERVGPRLRAELTKTAEELLAFQQPDGSINGDYNNFPVANGKMQATVQAIVTWRQVHARTANDRWLVPLRQAERYVSAEAKRMSDGTPASLYDADYALIGLVSAGAGSGDKVVRDLAAAVQKMQNQDGGYPFNVGQPSTPFMTGQALYALRLAGRSDGDKAVRDGTAWLRTHQNQDGGWGTAGGAKAEAMWAVLGLVSMDMVSIDVAGLEDGQHIDGDPTLGIKAADNSGKQVKKLTVSVDDVPVQTGCGSSLAAHVDAAKLSTGMHTVDIIAESEGGKTTERRLIVYAGDAYLQEVSTRFDNGKTVVGFRNLAPDAMKAKVRVHVLDENKKEVKSADVTASNGPMAWSFDGDKSGRYTAKVELLDAKGAVKDTKEVLFSHESYAEQQRKYAEVAGKVSLDNGADSQNADIEFVDDDGKVVQKTTSTRSGQYRFQNVDAGKYKVRVSKKGFKPVEEKLEAKAGGEAAPAPVAQARE